MLTLSLLRRSDALKRQDGNFAAGFALVFGKTRHHLDHFGVKLAAFGLSGRGGTDLEALGANLDGRDRVGQQVVVPVGIAGLAAFGGDDGKAVPIGDIGHRRGARLAAFRANGGQEQEGRVGKIAANLAVVGPKLIDSVLVKTVVLAHVTLLSTLLFISRQTFGGKKW